MDCWLITLLYIIYAYETNRMRILKSFNPSGHSKTTFIKPWHTADLDTFFLLMRQSCTVHFHARSDWNDNLFYSTAASINKLNKRFSYCAS